MILRCRREARHETLARASFSQLALLASRAANVLSLARVVFRLSQSAEVLSMSTGQEEVVRQRARERANEVEVVVSDTATEPLVLYKHTRCRVLFATIATVFEHECKADELPRDVRLLLKGRVASDRESRKRERETMRNFILDTSTRLSRLREVIDDEFELLSRITEALDYAERQDRESDEQFTRRLVEVESRTLDDAMSDKSDERRSKMASERRSKLCE